MVPKSIPPFFSHHHKTKIKSYFRRTAIKQSLGNKALIYPQPVLIVATYSQDGSANAMNAAWGAVWDYTKISIIIDRNHKTVENLLEKQAFTVSIADQDHLVQADYLGIVSGHKVPSKVTSAGLSSSKSATVDAPIIDDFPLTLECRLVSYNKETEQAIGEVVNTLADESILTNGKIDLTKFRPLTYDPMNHHYHVLGEQVGKAYSDGKKLKTD